MLAKTLRFSIWCFAALTLFGFLALILSMENNRRFASEMDISATAVRDASSFVSRESRKIINAKSPTTIKATQFEVNDTLTLVNRSYKRVSGYVTFENDRALLHLSIRSSVLGIGTFFNISGELLSSEKGLQWKRAKIGDLPLGPRGAKWLFNRGAYLVLGKQYGKQVLGGIGAISIKNHAISMRFTPPKNFQKGFADAANRVSGFVGQNIQLDTLRVQHYLDFLVRFTRKLNQKQHQKQKEKESHNQGQNKNQNTSNKISISYFLTALFNEVKQQRHQYNLAPRTENISAIYALAIQVAPGTFRHFVNDLRVNKLNATQSPVFILGGREDLAKHFIYSAALKILSDKGVSFSIGEAKELIDASAGGSGFSFADLTADRAGIRFAEVASNHADTAQLLQEIVASGLQENDIFPPLHGLPEGISEVSFQAMYSGTDSKEYQEMLDEIDKRLSACPILSL